MKELVKQLESIINAKIYCILENELYYIITSNVPDQIYVVDKELMLLFKQTQAYDEEGAQLIKNSKMIYCSDPQYKDDDLFDVEY